MIEQGALSRDELNKLLRIYILQGLKEFDQKEATGRKGNSDNVDDAIEGFEMGMYEFALRWLIGGMWALSSRRQTYYLMKSGCRWTGCLTTINGSAERCSRPESG